MSEEEPPAELESDAETTYASQFRRHLADFRAHLAGVDVENLQPSFVPPTGYWTHSEKETFFHSLTVFSRFRPDLIAARIGTKTVMDVCTYIDTLDEALAQNQHLLSLREDFDVAMEVSNDWVRWEETRAEVLTALELQWESELLSVQREEEISAKQSSSSIVVEGNFGKDELNGWELGLRRRWSQEDTLKRLSVDHLRVLEGILREGDTHNIEPEDSPVPGTHPEDHQGQTLILPPPKSQSPVRPILPSVVSDLIGPALLKLSGHPFPNSGNTALVQPTNASPCPKDSSYIPSPLPQPRPTSILLQPDSRSPSPENEQATLGSSALSPASRRRFQKRLYMRRKRATERGEEVVAAVAKLRPGRKGKDKPHKKSRRRTSDRKDASQNNEKAGEIPMDIEQDATFPADAVATDVHPVNGLESPKNPSVCPLDDNEEEQESARNIPSGLTKPYKIKKQFAAKGINADILTEGNLGLFHLSTLSRFMMLYKTGYDTATSPVACSISADTIRLLAAIIVEFTTEVVQRTVISCEQEKHMKGGIKVWGKAHDEITPENVDHVLEMMGMQGMTREKYFAQLLGEDTLEPPEAEESNPSDDDNDLDEDDESMNGDTQDSENDSDGPRRQDWPTVFPALLPLHCEIHPPFVHLPNSLTPSYDGAEAAEKDILMAVDTDEEELEEELQEEDELDESDKKNALDHELTLWKQFSMEKKSQKRNRDRAS
ncbi:hypothetical protein Hypma_002638 [Hypsizygus marmoreus]|uniref:Uncharacterized protein n=1 Tax=Hypsizygus marmoreus TaxID=39966 RepID=A0A369JB81_HYPMA|nr:hypothetical protein Hypma_002638 [Hypsizygus marmoreus]